MDMDREAPRALARRLGPVGVWTAELSGASAADARAYVRDLENLGAGAVWIAEGVERKEVFAHAGILLAAGERIVVGTGIANIWARDAHAMANGARALAEAYPGRFLLGLGVSHSSRVAQRGGHYTRPLRRMRQYLEEMEGAAYHGPAGEGSVPRVLGAQGPQMLELAAARTSGAHPYFVPVQHTVMARGVLGQEPLLAVEQAVVCDEDPERARATARRYMDHYLERDNYRNSLLRLGFGEADIDGGGSDALVDAIVAWGSVDALRARVRAHLDAGADHVCVQTLGRDRRGEVELLGQLMAGEW